MVRQVKHFKDGTRIKFLRRMRNSNTKPTPDIINRILFWSDDHREKDKDVERFKLDMCKRFPVFEKRCSVCFFNYIGVLFVYLFNESLVYEKCRTLLADYFLTLFMSFKLIDDELVKNLDETRDFMEIPNNNTRDKSKINFYALFREQTEIVIAVVKREKPLLKQFDFDDFLQKIYPKLHYCAVERHFENDMGHHGIDVTKPFFDLTSRIFRQEFKYSPVSYYK